VHESLHPVLARTLRGIEWIARDEVRARLGVAPRLGHRELRFRAALSPALLALGTVDDVFLVLGEVDGISRRRESLRRLSSVSLDLDAAGRLLDRSGPRTFDVTASFLGRRNYSRFELEDVVAAGRGWTRVPARGELSLRVHVAGEVATIGARIAREPLHRRSYRVATVRGSVHPPLARTLALLAGAPFLDPFCGAGTIAIEGALAGVATQGSDLDPGAVRAARRNAAAAGVGVPFRVADAAELEAAECVVTNPPWGRALPAVGASLPRAARSVVLTGERRPGRNVVLEQAVRVHGALAYITVTSG
jgi:hypothetical protein